MTVTSDELTAWALRNGWRMIGGHPSLSKPSQPGNAIVRLVLSHVMQPSGTPDQTATDIAWIATRVLR